MTPRDGDILNRHDGVEDLASLSIRVAGVTPRGSSVSVSGIPATVEGGSFWCTVPISQRKSDITAAAEHNGKLSRDRVAVLWDKQSAQRYRLSVEDNIEFFQDLAGHPDDFESLFDHWYLAFWRRMHREYGVKVHLCIYYQTVGGGFTLEQMPPTWRDEWESHADWLRLSFHALQDQPDRIYKDATYDQMARDYDLVVREIERFAGEVVLSNTTTVHWNEAPREACRALRDRGIRVLIAHFQRDSRGECTTAYYLPEDTKDYANTRDYYYDPETDLIFVASDAIVNNLALDAIDARLDGQASSPHTSELIELLTHEQYFLRDDEHYQPDIGQKVIKSLNWVTDQSYRPVFWGDGFLGSPMLPA
jgi:hypothetical protein